MKDSKLKQIGNAVRKTVNPSPQELNERTRKLRERNDAYEEKVRALESRRREQTRRINLREREIKARQPPTAARSSNRSKSAARIGDPSGAFDVFANHPLFGGGGTTQRKGKQKPPKEFDWNLI